ncbi:hypothetical protein HC251_17125 [Iamia sp. SCSIO 61187]|uniref:hypothetical protein n=1 Tax=Iamia sp. SCSIO 61187 TaxID=2722752 RepID=UPI001C6316A2|nr:hypothetical protein [Iamia sp. SCSIO 61187]QYG93986.1 hypothetical protein HC251_17125 [Iamia sp. SCSIO 61187]
MLAVLGNDTFIHRLFFLLHILTAIVAFAPAFVWPIVNAQTRKRGVKVSADVAGQAAVNNVIVHGPALVLAGVFGLLMVITSTESISGDKVFEFSQAWVSIAFLLWFALVGVVFGLLAPSERKAAAGDAAAGKRAAMFGGIVHLLLLLTLIDMIWKPGL